MTRLVLADCIEAMREMEPESVDAVVTDPPYGINFMGKAWDGKAIEQAAAQPRELNGATRLTGSPDGPRHEIERTGSGFANRAGEAGAYDFSVGRFGDERDWGELGGPIGKDHTKQRERSGSMHAGEYDLTPRGNRGFQAWCEMWAREAFRVLKPGGHMLVFGGTRTYHRMAAGIEDAGFEIRDCLAWMYGSGFPKSLDVGKAIDGLDRPCASQMAALDFTGWLRSTGITARAINEATGTVMGGHFLTAKSQPAIPTSELWALIRPLIADVPAAVDEMIGFRAVSENLARREVVGERAHTEVLYAPGSGREPEARTVYETRPFTPEAQDWHGWGTALKPAFEPVVVARKPLVGTVGRNVLAHGTGALNVDGCRIATGDEVVTAGLSDPDNRTGVVGQAWQAPSDKERNQQAQRESIERTNTLGRWPANVVLDEEAASMLDEQSGASSSTSSVMPLPAGHAFAGPTYGGDSSAAPAPGTVRGHDDTGGASRFFYCAKVSAAERNAGLRAFKPQETHRYGEGIGTFGGALDRNIHPTVKPIALMRWLVRLVTPPGGTVLDPFLGSGTTGCAAVLEGFDFIGCEREPDYLPIAEARIAFWAEHGEDGLELVKAVEAGEQRRADIAAAGQLELFGAA